MPRIGFAEAKVLTADCPAGAGYAHVARPRIGGTPCREPPAALPGTTEPAAVARAGRGDPRLSVPGNEQHRARWPERDQHRPDDRGLARHWAHAWIAARRPAARTPSDLAARLLRPERRRGLWLG